MDARIMGRKWVGGVVALLLSVFLLFGSTPARAGSREHTGRRFQVVGLTNHDRSTRGRAPLDFNGRISRYAEQHSRDMAKKGYLYHSDTGTLMKILAPYDWSIGGENVGVGGSLDGLETAFMHSKDHRENILRRQYDHMAVGVFLDGDTLWVTVIFYG